MITFEDFCLWFLYILMRLYCREEISLLSYIWLGMVAVSFVCALCKGNMEQLSKAVLDGADKAVELVISMAGVMCLWTGIMKIADKGGLTSIISKVLSPILSKLMPEYDKESAAMKAVSANITANILGLGNAATPFGIVAMKEMQKTNTLRDSPNNSMIIFVIINTASIQLIPTTIAALRQASGSVSPYSILPYIWITSLLTLVSGIVIARIFMLKGRVHHG